LDRAAWSATAAPPPPRFGLILGFSSNPLRGPLRVWRRIAFLPGSASSWRARWAFASPRIEGMPGAFPPPASGRSHRGQAGCGLTLVLCTRRPCSIWSSSYLERSRRRLPARRRARGRGLCPHPASACRCPGRLKWSPPIAAFQPRRFSRPCGGTPVDAVTLLFVESPCTVFFGDLFGPLLPVDAILGRLGPTPPLRPFPVRLARPSSTILETFPARPAFGRQNRGRRAGEGLPESPATGPCLIVTMRRRPSRALRTLGVPSAAPPAAGRAPQLGPTPVEPPVVRGASTKPVFGGKSPPESRNDLLLRP